MVAISCHGNQSSDPTWPKTLCSPNRESMTFFSDAQGQLTLQSMVVSGPILKSSELSCMSSLPVSMKKDQISREIVATAIFGRLTAGKSVVRGRVWPNFELIKALTYGIVTCKCGKDPTKNS